MSLFMEIETDRKLPFDARKIAELVIETSLDYVKCPYETEVSLLLTTCLLYTSPSPRDA